MHYTNNLAISDRELRPDIAPQRPGVIHRLGPACIPALVIHAAPMSHRQLLFSHLTEWAGFRSSVSFSYSFIALHWTSQEFFFLFRSRSSESHLQDS